MAIDPHKRQKKLARRKAKQKAERRALTQHDSQSLAYRIEKGSVCPVLHCCIMGDIWQQGIGQVLLSRELKDGNVVYAVFLVDVHCLGVKNAMFGVTHRMRYDSDVYERMASRFAPTPIKPECARKLVEGAVQYAFDLGFLPHDDYHTAKLIFGNIAAEACTETYTFGKNGKPYFIGGPFDSESRCERILHTLHEKCGPDGYHYIVPVGPSTLIDGRGQ